MNWDIFEQKMTAAREYMQALVQQFGLPSAPPQAETSHIVQELSVALEELRVTERALRQQSEELRVAREAAEAERRHYQKLFGIRSRRLSGDRYQRKSSRRQTVPQRCCST